MAVKAKSEVASVSKRYLDKNEACAYLGVGQFWLKNNLHRIKHTKLSPGQSGAVRFDIRDLDAFMEAGKRGGEDS